MGLPYFFYYAKDKKLDQVDGINNSTLNKIVAEIKDTNLMFNVIKPMDKINYLLMLKNKKDVYFNEEINGIYDKYNKVYGNNLNIDDYDNNKNNIKEICNELKKDLYKIEADDDKILNSLVKHLYSKNTTRKKKILWVLYGEEIYKNLKENLDDDTEVCAHCGRRVEKGKLVKYKCDKCRKSEIKRLGGKKKIKCIDCGKEFEVNVTSNRTVRCGKCQEIANKEKRKQLMRKKRNKM